MTLVDSPAAPDANQAHWWRADEVESRLEERMLSAWQPSRPLSLSRTPRRPPSDGRHPTKRNAA